MSEFEEYITGQLDLGVMHAARDRAIANSVCLDPPTGCGQLAVVFRDELSFREYQITGLCQVCQDNMEAYYAQQEAQYEREERLAIDALYDDPNYDEPPF